MAETQKPARRTPRSADPAGLSAEEKEAMRDLARERRAAKSRKPGNERADGERDLLAKIAELPEPDRTLATRIHALVMAAAPDLLPRTWYGMPAWSLAGKTICFFQAAAKFKVRYATFGFQPDAKLDAGPFWPTSFALIDLTPEVEAELAALVRRAAG